MKDQPTLKEQIEPRAVKNGMSQAEYDTWMFLSDKTALDEPYTFAIKQSDLTALIAQKQIEAVTTELKTMWNKTQPDTVPEGWTPETDEGKYLQKRLKALTKDKES